MLKRISIDDLSIGMYVEAVTKQTGAAKIKTRGRVGSQKVIDKLRAQGILQLAIDPENVLPQQKTEQTPAAAPESEAVPEPAPEPKVEIDPTKRTVGFEQEVGKASQLYSQAKKLQKLAFADALSGRKINTKGMEKVASGFIDSVFRNQDALTCMTQLKEKDDYLLEHSVNVSILMTILAKHMKLDKERIHELATGALLHDIGKVKIDDKILHKPGKLTKPEMKEMQKHALYTREILQNADGIAPVSLEVACNHHERLDGSGYPRGLTAEKISIPTRMIAIVDSYDAMTADRCYKDGMNPINAFKLLKRDIKTCFDETVVNLFIQAIGIHPVGTLVQLKSQKLGIVIQTNFVDPLKPVVKVFYHAKFNHHTEIRDIDLTQSNDSIESCVKPESFKIDLKKFFKTAVLR
ncbi:MAG: HD-GYP domain-containing protein (c-di-GMP phosphodiesterase class II) [Phenylobacterium sp.]|jgi:HD-GYP domain-containing protein (c-di-GMP phosphodiesterase class II)